VGLNVMLSRIVFINRFFHPDLSATAQILSDLAFYLAAEGRLVHVVTSRLSYNQQKVRYPAREKIRGVEIHRVATTHFGRSTLLRQASDFASFYMSAASELFRIVRPGDVVVAKTDPPLISVAAAAVCMARRATLVNWLQDLYPDVAERYRMIRGPSLAGRLLTALRNTSLRSAQTNIAVGEKMAEHLIAAGADSSSVRVIPNWADEEQIRPISEADNFLRREWMLDGSFVVGYSGNLGRAHEAETLLKAAEMLKNRRELRFLFIGGGHHRELLETEVRRRELTNFVFKPYQSKENLALSLSVADVHWLSLRPEFEGLLVPSKLYGIAAAGRGVVCVTDPEGELARLVRSHSCGAAVRPGDGEGLAHLISHLADHPNVARAWGARARIMLEKNYARRKSLQAWSFTLDAVITGSGPGTC
jgi:colanic acid biosynthesis glycosyl transferase WcaI